MDHETFDRLARGVGAIRNRRGALKGMVAGLFGLGLGREAASTQAQARLATCGQQCLRTEDCNAGLRCARPGAQVGRCVAYKSSGASCQSNIDCDRDFEVCRSRRCVNQVTCNRCAQNADCPSGQICRNGQCVDRCRRDSDCPSNQVCRDGRCVADSNRCNDSGDCRRDERCRNGRCVQEECQNDDDCGRRERCRNGRCRRKRD